MASIAMHVNGDAFANLVTFGSQGSQGLALSDLNHGDQEVIEGSLGGAISSESTTPPRICIGCQICLSLKDKTGKWTMFPIDQPRPDQTGEIEALKGAADMIQGMYRQKLINEVEPVSLQKALEGRTVIWPSDHPFVKVQTIVYALQTQNGASLYVDSRVKDDLVYLRCRAGDQVDASVLAFALAKAMGMFWRPVGNQYFLAVSPGDPSIEGRRKWLIKESGGMRAFLQGLESSDAYEGVRWQALFDGPLPTAAADLGVLRSLAPFVIGGADGHIGQQGKMLLNDLSQTKFLLGSFQLWNMSTLMVSGSSVSSAIGVPLKDVPAGIGS